MFIFSVDTAFARPTTMNINADNSTPVSVNNSMSGDIRFGNSKKKWAFVSKLHCINDTIYILDSMENTGLYVYDINGRPLYDFTSSGTGSGQFLSLSDFNVSDDCIRLLDSRQRKILTIDKKGKFKKSENLKNYITAFQKDSDGGMWYNHGNTVTPESDTKLIYARDDHTENVLAVPEKIANITITAVAPFSSASDGTVHYLADFEPRVYECKDGKAELLWDLDFGGRWIPDDKIATGEHPLTIMQGIEADGYVYQLNILEDNEKVYFPFTCEKTPYIAIHDKKSGETKTYSFDTDQQPVGIINGAIVIPGEDSLTLITIE